MDLILGVMDEGYHLGSAVAALIVITHTVYLGLESADEVTSLVQKCLLLHFHVVRLSASYRRPGTGVLLEVAVWLLDMAFHLWFLLIDCTRVVSSLYFHSRPLQVLHCAILFIFHLQILRRYCTGIHVTMDNVVPDEANAQQMPADEPAVVDAPPAVAARPEEGDESSLLPGCSQSSATKFTSQSAPVADELSLDFARAESETSSRTCRCYRHAGTDGVSSQVDDLQHGRSSCGWSLEPSAPADSDSGPPGKVPIPLRDTPMFLEGPSVTAPTATSCGQRLKSIDQQASATAAASRTAVTKPHERHSVASPTAIVCTQRRKSIDQQTNATAAASKTTVAKPYEGLPAAAPTATACVQPCKSIDQQTNATATASRTTVTKPHEGPPADAPASTACFQPRKSIDQQTSATPTASRTTVAKS
ncbi:uncharacterized protein LOC144100202 isoform X1 [Amblyomma americanum]